MRTFGARHVRNVPRGLPRWLPDQARPRMFFTFTSGIVFPTNLGVGASTLWRIAFLVCDLQLTYAPRRSLKIMANNLATRIHRDAVSSTSRSKKGKTAGVTRIWLLISIKYFCSFSILFISCRLESRIDEAVESFDYFYRTRDSFYRDDLLCEIK